MKIRKFTNTQKGFNISKSDVTTVGNRLDSLAEHNNGDLTPDIVLGDAKDPASPLHQFFIWDNTEAAHKFRIIQASRLISAIAVIVKTNGDEQAIQAYVAVKNPVPHGSKNVWRSIARIATEEETQRQIFARMASELEAINARYSQYAAYFAAVKKAAIHISAAVKTLRPKTASKQPRVQARI